MAIKDKVQTALDENRMLVLGCQVLLGVQFRAFFEPAFPRLSWLSQRLMLGGLFALAVAFAMLLAPSAYHRIAARGEDTPAVLRFSGALMWPAVLPLIGGLGTAFFVAGERLFGRAAAWGLFAVSVAVGLFMLMGLEVVMRARRRKVIEPMERDAERREDAQKRSDVKDKIRHVLTEARLVLPGAQALLGFQFVIMLMEKFDELPASSKLIHLGAFGCVALAVVLLLAPAAYHRIVERGESTEHMHRFGSAMVLAATVPLGLGVAADVFVIVRKVTQSLSAAAITSALLLAFTYGLWFGVTLLARGRQARERPAGARSAEA